MINTPPVTLIGAIKSSICNLNFKLNMFKSLEMLCIPDSFMFNEYIHLGLSCQTRELIHKII
jgi:hypothetical protein